MKAWHKLGMERENLWLFLNSIFSSAASMRPRLSKPTVCIWNQSQGSGYIQEEKERCKDNKIDKVGKNITCAFAATSPRLSAMAKLL